MLRATILIMALMAGGVAAWLSTGMSRATPLATEPGMSASALVHPEVLVAGAAVVPGTLVEAGNLRWQPWPQEALNETFILRSVRPDAAEELAGMIAPNGVVAGEPVNEGKLAAGDAGTLSVMLEPGRRAVAVRISAENTAGGLIMPNDRVDVLHTTTRTDAGGQAEASSRVILGNVRVLAIDQMVDSSSGAVVGKTATLELGAEQVEVIASAEAYGAISLALRSLADNNETFVAEAAESKTVRIFRAGQEETIDLN